MLKSCVAALAASFSIAVVSEDRTVTGTENIAENIDGALIVDGGNATVIENVGAASYTVKGGGTLTIGASKTLTIGQSSNYVGCLDTPGSSVVDASGVSHLVLEEGATLKDTSNSEVIMDAARHGGAAEITVRSGAFLDLFWKYLYASCNSDEMRNGYGRTTLNLYGRANIGEIHTADWFWNEGTTQDPLTWPESLTVNLYDGGWLGTRCISMNDTSLTRLVFHDGGKLTFRWRGNFIAGGGGALVFNFASGVTELNTAFEVSGDNGVTVNKKTCYLTGAGAINKTGGGVLAFGSDCDISGFTGDVYLTQDTLSLPIVADGVARKVYFQGGALSVPENGTFVTVANGGSVEFVSVNGAAIRLISNGNAKISNGVSVLCSGTGRPVLEGTFVPGGELCAGSDSDGAISSAIPDGVAYGKIGAGTDTIIVPAGPSKINIHEGKVRTGKFRFWRMVFDENAGTGGGVQISELAVYVPNENGDLVAINVESGEDRNWTVTSHSTWGNQDESAEKAFDWNLGSKFLSFDGFGGNADIIIEFPKPREIRAYQWYTANDCLDPNNGDCRTPTAWHWLASADGVNWLEVGRESGFNPATSNENPEECATNAYKLAGTWWLVYEKTHLVDTLASSTVTIDPGAALLVDTDDSVPVGNVVNNGGAVELSVAGATLNPVGDFGTRGLSGGGITGLGGIVKSGSGTTCATGVNTYSGDTVVAGGTYAVTAESTDDPKFFRFTFQNSGGASQFAWLKLCAADGSVQSTKLTEATAGTAAASLAQGQFSRTTDFQQWGGEVIANIFDESPNTKFGGSGSGEIVMRLPDSAKRIATFDVMSGGDDNPYTDRRLEYFKLEASLDGNTWQTVSEVDVTDRNAANSAWYSGGSGFFVRMPGAASTTADATIPAGSTVEVKPGATLAVETAMTISSLRIDIDAEKAVLSGNGTPGRIVGLNAAPNGTLELTCTDPDVLSAIDANEDVAVALDIASFSETSRANLRAWSCTLNGTSCCYCLVPVEGSGNSKLKFKGAFAIFIR